jgi:hypothetical protein
VVVAAADLGMAQRDIPLVSRDVGFARNDLSDVVRPGPGRVETRSSSSVYGPTVRSAGPAKKLAPTGKRQIRNPVMISERPAEAEDRAVPGHWEGDLGKRQTTIGTLVERWSRYVMLFSLPEGNTAESVRTGLGEVIQRLPDHLWQSLTWDQGKEMAEHAQFTVDTGIQIYFCDPSRRGSEVRTKTPTDCSVSISPRPPTWPHSPKTSSTKPPRSDSMPFRPPTVVWRRDVQNSPGFGRGSGGQSGVGTTENMRVGCRSEGARVCRTSDRRLWLDRGTPALDAGVPRSFHYFMPRS